MSKFDRLTFTVIDGPTESEIIKAHESIRSGSEAKLDFRLIATSCVFDSIVHIKTKDCRVSTISKKGYLSYKISGIYSLTICGGDILRLKFSMLYSTASKMGDIRFRELSFLDELRIRRTGKNAVESV